MQSVVPDAIYYQGRGLPVKSKQGSWVLSVTWTACLSGAMMLREVEGAWVHTVLLGLTVAMAMAADVEVLWGAGTAVLLVSDCFSPGLSLSISRVTHCFSNGKTGENRFID